ncbi:MAG: hypothetical protein ACPG7F_00325 [Aggregatilineales bacterium]
MLVTQTVKLNTSNPNLELLNEELKAALGSKMVGLGMEDVNVFMYLTDSLTEADFRTMRQVVQAHNPAGKTNRELDEAQVKAELNNLRHDMPDVPALVNLSSLRDVIKSLKYMDARLKRIERKMGIDDT